MTHIVSYQIDLISFAVMAEVMKPAPGFFECPVSKVMLHECKELKSFRTKTFVCFFFLARYSFDRLYKDSSSFAAN